VYLPTLSVESNAFSFALYVFLGLELFVVGHLEEAESGTEGKPAAVCRPYLLSACAAKVGPCDLLWTAGTPNGSPIIWDGSIHPIAVS
jgi:hypothetical protein